MTRAALIALALATPAHALPIADVPPVWTGSRFVAPECVTWWHQRAERTTAINETCNDTPYGGGKGEKWTMDGEPLIARILTEAFAFSPTIVTPQSVIGTLEPRISTSPRAGDAHVIHVWPSNPPTGAPSQTPQQPSPVPLPATLALLLVGLAITWAAARKG